MPRPTYAIQLFGTIACSLFGTCPHGQAPYRHNISFLLSTNLPSKVSLNPAALFYVDSAVRLSIVGLVVLKLHVVKKIHPP